jgi:hypothetical protein
VATILDHPEAPRLLDEVIRRLGFAAEHVGLDVRSVDHLPIEHSSARDAGGAGPCRIAPWICSRSS